MRGVDYHETIAPTGNLTSVRALLLKAAQHDLILHQMDVKTAYLNAPIDCEIYVDQAEGFEAPSSSNGRLMYKLNKSLHGLKQSGRNWNNVLHCFLLDNQFVQSPVDNCMYTKQLRSKMVVILVWVEDIIIAVSDMVLMSEVKQMLQERFCMKDLHRLSYFLGIDFEQVDGFVKMSQRRYLRGCPCKNRPLDFRPNTEFLQIFYVRQLVHMINKNSNNLALSAIFQYFWRRFPNTVQNRKNRSVSSQI